MKYKFLDLLNDLYREWRKENRMYVDGHRYEYDSYNRRKLQPVLKKNFDCILHITGVNDTSYFGDKSYYTCGSAFNCSDKITLKNNTTKQELLVSMESILDYDIEDSFVKIKLTDSECEFFIGNKNEIVKIKDRKSHKEEKLKKLEKIDKQIKELSFERKLLSI